MRRLGVALLVVMLASSLPALAGEVRCADGLDDDLDGFTDCADTECVRDVACAGFDHDGDAAVNGVDCAPLDPGSFAEPSAIPRLDVNRSGPTDANISWDDIASSWGVDTAYDVVTGEVGQMRADRALRRAILLGRGVSPPSLLDTRLLGRSGDGYWYLVRARNACGPGIAGNVTLDADPPYDEAPTNCSDGQDNDGDTVIDCADPDCTDDPACPEDCRNAADDDADGLVDCGDPECSSDPACREAGRCTDGVDNDLDGDIDCADSECAAAPPCCPFCPNGLPIPAPLDTCQTVSGSVAACPRALYQVSLTAGSCVQFSTCSCGGSATFETSIVARDPSCAFVASSNTGCPGGGGSLLRLLAATTGTHSIMVTGVGGQSGDFVLSYSTCDEVGSCSNGVDDDIDGATDCADSDCWTDPACDEALHCSNGRDDDGDTLTDCGDPDCFGTPGCPEDCTNGIDDDSDTLVDCADADCAGVGSCPCPVCASPGVTLLPPTPAYQFVQGRTTLACSSAFHAVDLVAGLCYEFTFCTPGDAWFDSVLSLFDPSCALLMRNDDYCFADSNIVVSPQSSGTFVLEVSGSANSVGGFNLAYRQVACSEAPAKCSDGQDNDIDGLTDCADPDCTGIPPC